MPRRRQTKIVATLGPATSSEAEIAALVAAGADVFRFNFSHGTCEEHAARLATVRKIARDLGRPIGVFADLQGPKLRLGHFADGAIKIRPGDRLRLDLDTAPGDSQRVNLPHPEIFEALKPGANLLLDDGKVRLTVEACGADFAETKVAVGSELSDHKGVNVPDVSLAISALTEKDRSDLAFALDQGFGLIALSFVQHPDNVREAKKLIQGRAFVLAKIEKPQAIRHLYDVIEATDAVMVARGDLGVEMPAEEVPVLQRRIIRACRYAGRPVIVATQMLDSMINAPTPTRAEASDVAAAVNEGTDAVMLSGETAVGKYPVEAVTIMDRIIRRAENDRPYRGLLDATRTMPETTAADAITAAARSVAETVGAVAIVTFTNKGATTVRAARERPLFPIIALTPNVYTEENLKLVWGVHPRIVDSCSNVEQVAAAAERVAVDLGFGKTGDKIVVTYGIPMGSGAFTNMLQILTIP